MKLGAEAMKAMLTNKTALDQVELSICESQKRLDFLEREMQRLSVLNLSGKGDGEAVEGETEFLIFILGMQRIPPPQPHHRLSSVNARPLIRDFDFHSREPHPPVTFSTSKLRRNKRSPSHLRRQRKAP